MKDYGNEQVLAIEKDKLEDVINDFFGLHEKGPHLQQTEAFINPARCSEFEEMFDCLINDHGRWLLRNAAEVDFGHKQIIPYCMIGYRGTLLHYSRAKTAAEARLSGMRSIGAGGHINPIDFDSGSYPVKMRDVLLRELSEEIGLDPENVSDICFFGWVNDEVNEVGQVHFGAVIWIELKTPEIGEIEEHLTDVRFGTLEEIQAEHKLESWSQLILPKLSE